MSFFGFPVLFAFAALAQNAAQQPVVDAAALRDWPELRQLLPATLRVDRAQVFSRSLDRRSCVIWGSDDRGPVNVVVAQREGQIAATLLDGDGSRFWARGAVGAALEFDPLPEEALRDCGGAVVAPDPLLLATHMARVEGGVAGACNDAETVDVLVLTTPGAESQAGGAAQLGALVDLAETSANAAYINSQTPMRIRVLFDLRVSYTEQLFGTDLSSLASPTDGTLDFIHQVRDVAGADLVAMVRTSGEYCGIAYLLPDNAPTSSGIGFSVTAWSCLASQTFAHELGHNMGCCHAPLDGGGCTSGGIFPQSVGHRFTATNGTMYRTVMAYAPGNRIDHFSNPLVNYGGTPTGIAATAGDPGRDNAGTLTTTRDAMRGFRCAAPSGLFGDCDQDGRIDVLQLASGAASDCDGNGALDRCDLASTTLCASPSRFVCSGGVITGVAPQPAVADNFFGFAVATDGKTLAVGSYGDDIGGAFAGSTAVYSITEVNTQLVATLRHVGPAAYDLFGRALAVDGDTLVVSAESRDVAGLQAVGDVTIFKKSATGAPWQVQATLSPPTPTEAARFGAAVALQGDVLVVGSPQVQVSSGSPQRGRAYIYQRNGNAWTLAKTLDPLDQTNQGNFGFAVDVSQDTVVVGAPYVTNSDGIEVGAAYVSRRIGGVWQSAERLVQLPTTRLRSGSAVATSGERVFVGAPGAGPQSGSTQSGVHVMERTGSTWQPVQLIEASSAVNGPKFGTRLAVDGDRLLVGSWGTTDSNGQHEYFIHNGGSWEAIGLLRDGFAVDLRGEVAAVGAYREVINGVVSGDVRLSFRFSDADSDGLADRCERAAGDTNLDGAVDGIDLAGVLAAWATSSEAQDCNRDGIVDGTDIAVVLANW
ncbi:MAG: reprolysin-like metallopeptidase [Planctomycetota bacterium]